MIISKSFLKNYARWQSDWNLFSDEILRAGLDKQQRAILTDIQFNSRVSVRSGTSRGKDYVAAVASLCFLYLTPLNLETKRFESCKVINTAPTGRQVKNIMMPEISRLYNRGGLDYFQGNLLTDGIRFDKNRYPDWFLFAFKADNNNIEAWSGYHASNIMIVATEASGLNQTIFDSMEGCLQGNSRLLLIFNPNNQNGEAYKSTRSTLYKKHRLNSLDAPNVINYQRYIDNEISLTDYRKLQLPGQVNWEWIDEKIQKGWAEEIEESKVQKERYDFEWNHKFYRPNDLFRVKVLGEFAEESEDVLIPMSWIEAANKRWEESNKNERKNGKLSLGIDIAGMGRDNSVFCYRYDDFVSKFEVMPLGVERETIHMQASGKVKSILDNNKDCQANIDTIGEGAGVYSRLKEQEIENAISAKGSFGAKGKKDITNVYEFINMRAYMYWAIRDALNPAHGINLALPPDDELTEELNVIKWQFNSNGKIQIMSKEDIKKEIKRSPDKADALSLTYFPVKRSFMTTSEDISNL